MSNGYPAADSDTSTTGGTSDYPASQLAFGAPSYSGTAPGSDYPARPFAPLSGGGGDYPAGAQDIGALSTEAWSPTQLASETAAGYGDTAVATPAGGWSAERASQQQAEQYAADPAHPLAKRQAAARARRATAAPGKGYQSLTQSPAYAQWAAQMHAWMQKYGANPAAQQELAAWKQQYANNPFARAWMAGQAPRASLVSPPQPPGAGAPAGSQPTALGASATAQQAPGSAASIISQLEPLIPPALLNMVKSLIGQGKTP